MNPAQFRTDFDRFHDYNCLLTERIVYYGSEEDIWEEESGVDYRSTKSLIKNLLFLDRTSSKIITLYINTPGGDWYHGMAVYDVIKGLRSSVRAVCTGHIMSLGTIILQACKDRLITQNCGFMVHDGYDQYNGTSKSLETFAQESKHLRYRMYEIYLQRMIKKNPDVNIKYIEDLCSHDTYLKPEEVVDLGLADKILK